MMQGVNHMRMMLVKKGSFPYGRDAACCPKKIKDGESVLLMNVQENQLVMPIVLHRTCLSETVDKMPLGKKETSFEFAKMKEQIQRTGMLFPDEEDPDGIGQRKHQHID